VRFVEAPLRLLAVLVQVVRVEIVVGATCVLVVDVDVAVGDERLRREQIMGLVAGVVGVAEGVEPEGRGVNAEEEKPDGRRPSHPRRATTPAL
jgi:hypothetical protein